MRSLVLAVALLAAALCATPVEAAPTLRASSGAICAGTPNGSSQLTCALGTALSAGDAIVACTRTGNSYNVLSMSDGTNGSYTLGTQEQAFAFSARNSRCGWFINSGAATPTVTVTYDNNTGTAEIYVAAFSGVKTTGSAIAEGGSGTSSSPADPATCANVSATASGQLLVGFNAARTPWGTIAPNSSETAITPADSSNKLVQMEYKLTSGSGNISASWDYDTSLDFSCNEVILDAATGTAPSFSAGPTYSTISNTVIRATFTANVVSLTYYCGLWLKGATPPTASEVAAGTNAHSAIATGSSTASSQTVDITASDSPSNPSYDPYCVLYNGTTYTAVPTTSTTATTVPTGFQYITLASVTATGSEPKAFNDADLITLSYDTQTANFTVGSVVVDATSGAWGYIRVDVDSGSAGTLTIDKRSGTFADNDALYDQGGAVALVSGSESAYLSIATSDVLVVPTTVSPSGASLAVDTSGQYVYTANGRQSALNGLIFFSAAQSYTALDLDAWFNNTPPHCQSPQTVVYRNGVTIDYDVSALCSDFDNDTLTYARISSLPAGATINPATGHVTGTVTADATTAASVIVYDQAGDYTTQAVTFIVQTEWPMPDCAGLTSSVCANQVLSLTTSSVSLSISSQCSASIASGGVISQSPAAGVFIAPGDTVSITESVGNICSVRSPDCTSAPTTTAACEALYNTAFSNLVSFAASSRCNNSLASGYVISTSPKANTEMPLNPNISIVSSLGTCSTSSKAMVNCISHTTAECLGLLQTQFGASVTLNAVTASCPTGYSSGEIFSQAPAAGKKTQTPAILNVTYCQ